MNPLYNDLVVGQKTTKKATKESKIQALETCPDNEPTMAELIEQNKALQAQIASPVVSIPTPVVKAVAFKEPRQKKATTLKKKEEDTGHSSKQLYALRCTLARLIKLGKIDGTKIECSSSGFPTCREWGNLSYNEMFDELAKFNAIK